MKIKQIKIEKLFGLDDNDFDIECYPNEYATILYAFNGVGKTTILRLIDAVINVKLQILDSVAFKKIQLIFDNDEFVVVEKLGDYKKSFINTCCKDLFIFDQVTPVYPIKYSFNFGNEKLELYIRFSERFLEIVNRELNKTIGDIKIDKHFINPLTFEDEANIFFNIHDLRAFESETYDKLKNNIHLNLLLANKQFEIPPRGEYDPNYEIFRNYPPTIDDLYLTDEQFKIICQLNNQLEEKNRTFLYELQLPIGHDKIKNICEIIKSRLHHGIQSEELKQYYKLLNEEFGFMYKSIEFDEKKGLKVVPFYTGDPELDVMKLSSGEKKLIILFFTLLFESNGVGVRDRQSIVLIDEPETSLHIAWQAKLVKNILEICKLKNIQVIIATHSPDVIDEYELFSTEIISKRYQDGKFFNK